MLMREGELEFDFVDVLSERLDDKQKPQPHGLQLVDFIIEEPKRILMVEIKDPSCKPKGNDEKALAGINSQRQQFVTKINNGELINHELVPKARDSYTYLHLMKRCDKPILYVFVLGVEQLVIDVPNLLVEFKRELLARLLQEAEQPWARRYVSDCLVLTEKTWLETFPQYPLARIAY